MSEFAQLLEAATKPPLRSRLMDLAKYVTLVADELEAVERRDLSRIEELEKERGDLWVTLTGPPGAEAEESDEEQASPAPLAEETLACLLGEALAELDAFASEYRENRVRWIALEDDAWKSLQGARARPALGGSYVEFGSSDGRLDVRF